MHDKPGTVTVRIDGEEHRTEWSPGTVLLEALKRAGIEVPHSCTEGSCGACVCRIVRGGVEMKSNRVLDDTDIAEGYLLACQAVATSDDVAVTYDD
ncbi:2Fe-2S iron-sulfur cluster binding domain-containing protein [Mycobacterium sp. CVI_P3]|uniref:2Fe-2S iron-sulfur cluster binding domain-containing protein n=1 Tax=Mycobacterium pinniadriaticum TaxID=2994102 RepID=A0ABT3SFP6_9MYCO|nr:2Fe-2S iron-sulfur cluster binding domain-containing protein [Mycobacterium pinniadriaticum]MCX2931649.1 2Fe-2S iron-sulfur cluster binding domain-containing protein [Mycobacterium pinniadriaticum]MCX2937959.1 2Fe-2S iron-sulfur cluster binding domain-containing protein [Mycobacterium pinniadriaticum]